MEPLFGKAWFKRRQGVLLFLLNFPLTRWWFRWCLRIHGTRSSVGRHDVTRILPNAIFWREGKKLKAEFRTHEKYRKRIYHAFYPLWAAMHAWDWAVADRWAPELSFGLNTLTKSPDADPETTTVDGRIKQDYGASGVSWATLHDKTEGTIVGPSDPGASCAFLKAATTTDQYVGMTRSAYLFDTSALTADVSILGAVMSIYGDTGAGGTDQFGGSTYDIVTSSPASNTDLVIGDFDNFGATSQTGSPIPHASWATGYNGFTLNATGRGNVSKTGVSKFGLREATYDIANTAPTWGSGKISDVYGYYADRTGTTQDPKLVVEYAYPKTINIEDAIAYRKGRSANIADQVGLTDLINRVAGFFRRPPDSVGIQDAAPRKASYFRAQADPVDVSDYEGRALVCFREMAEAVGIADAIAVLLAIGGTDWTTAIADTVSLTDAVRSALGRWRALADSIGIEDLVARAGGWSRIQADLVDTPDAEARAASAFRRLADDIGVEEATTYLLAIYTFRYIQDPVGITDAVTRILGLARLAFDQTTVTDAQLRTVAFSRIEQELLQVPDATTRVKAAFRIFADTVGVTDAIASLLSLLIARQVSDGVGVTDQITAVRGAGRIIADVLGVTDYDEKAKQMARLLYDAVSLTDEEIAGIGHARAIAEALGITDQAASAILTSLAHVRIIMDAIGVTDRAASAAFIIAWLTLTLALLDRGAFLGMEDPTITVDLLGPTIDLEVE